LNFFLLKEYIRYFHLKTDQHSLHSPFFYQFYLNLIKQNTPSEDWKIIESQRSELLKNESEFEIFDLGAGSKVEKAKRRKVKSIAQHSLSNAKFSRFLYRLIQYFNFKHIIELGTSLGINTAYLAKADPKAEISTFEADSYALSLAKEINKAHQNIKFYQGDISAVLPELLLKHNPKVDLVYADANHTYNASIEYFNKLLPYLHANSIYVMDDIHWSAGMKKAWEELKSREEITSSIDLFDAGLLFFNPDYEKQHYVLDF
jgi:predicted O-methyltransferase YrrM